MSLKAMILTPARWSQKHQTIPSVVHRLSDATSHKPPSREMKPSQPQTTQNAPHLEVSSPLLSTDVSGTAITIQDGKQEFQEKTQICFLIKPKVIHSSKSRGVEKAPVTSPVPARPWDSTTAPLPEDSCSRHCHTRHSLRSALQGQMPPSSRHFLREGVTVLPAAQKSPALSPERPGW